MAAQRPNGRRLTGHGDRRCGHRGHDYIDVHHILPLHASGPTTTRLQDLALLCANRHRMIHRGNPWLTPNELRAMLSSGT
ncbi:HNH endonuclease [Arthrobacter sp. MDT3-44]